MSKQKTKEAEIRNLLCWKKNIFYFKVSINIVILIKIIVNQFYKAQNLFLQRRDFEIQENYNETSSPLSTPRDSLLFW